MEKIQAVLVLEILGRPKENVKESLGLLINKLGAETGVKIIEENQHEPVEVKDANNLFTSFAEVTVELDSIENYFGIMFAYMPAHIEIISPEKITFENSRINEIGNRLVQRLHNYDGIAKKMIAEKDILLKKLYEIAPHLFKKQEQRLNEEKKLEEIATKEKKEKKKIKKLKKKKS